MARPGLVGARWTAPVTPLPQRPVQEAADERLHDVELVLKGEMAGVEKVQFGLRQVAQVRCRARSREYLVVLAPDDQRWRVAFAEEGLELRIERDVGPVCVEEVQLNVLITRTGEQRLVVAPIVRVDPSHVAHPV